ncbi:hypothetical protein HBI79_070640 [Parastagonospora nodorum]|nr:hypothetical protein HBI79_070640 [Parastagonospora nodorum]
MTKGILWVSSRITQPDKLSPEKFCKWYEDVHIQEVLVLPSLPSAIRWEAMSPQPGPDTLSTSAPWLTVYEMTDVDYRNSPAFRALNGQTPPPQELLDEIFKNARFDTRFYQEVQNYENPNVTGAPADGAFLISAALQPPASTEAIADFNKWYADEHLAMLAKAPGYVRTRRYELVDGTRLDGFERSTPHIPKFLALHEFGGEALPWGELQASAETEWAKRVMGGLVGSEIGWFACKRRYEEGVWGEVGK